MATFNEDIASQCKALEESRCDAAGTLASNYADRYGDSSAAWVMLCAILMFFMKAGFLYVELAFSDEKVKYRRRVILAKYVDTFASTIGFWLFGYAISGNTTGFAVGEEQDYIFWFFRFTFASNTATIIGGTLVGHKQKIQLRIVSIFIYAFFMSSFIHPPLARWIWSAGRNENLMFSPFRFCNGTRTVERNHRISNYSSDEDLGEFVFLDFAGSGVVHLCGGMAALILQLFHKLEKNVAEGTWNIPCKWSKYEEAETQQMEMQGGFNQATSQLPQGQNERLLSQQQSTAIVGEDPVMESNDKTFLGWMYGEAGGSENVESAVLGVLILWTTWFGFNAGSTETIQDKTAHAAVGRIALVMALAAASGGITSTIVSGLVQIHKRHENFNVNEIANGVLACLVAVTGCCPFIDPPLAILIGVLTILFYHIGCVIVYLIGTHDGARVFPVHGVCGFWGVLCVGIFSRSCLIKEIYGTACYCTGFALPNILESQGYRFLFQLAGGLFIAVWSALLCFVLFTVLWLTPIKLMLNKYMLGNRWLFDFSNQNKGIIDFKGNMLFTHFSEIGAPDMAGDMNAENYYEPPQHQES